MTKSKTEKEATKIARRNAKFAKMTNQDKRLAIAKDVISQVKARKYIAKPGTYHDFVDYKNDIAVGGGYSFEPDAAALLQKTLLKEKGAECYVCGLGAAFCSLSRVGDSIVWGDREHYVLKKIFGQAQVEMIESAFEKRSMGDSKTLEKKLPKILDFADKYPNNEERLLAIFQNIVKNKGTFKP